MPSLFKIWIFNNGYILKKLILSSVVFIVLCFLAIQFIALPKAQRNLNDTFQTMGFKHTQINDLKVSLKGLSINKIALDQDGFDSAENITINLFWPSYIFKSDIKKLVINKIKISSIANNVNDIVRYKSSMNIEKINSLKIDNIEIKNFVWDIATAENAIRMEGNLKIDRQGDNKNITSNISAAQHELNFISQWAGVLNNNNDYNIEGTFDEFGFSAKPISMNRGTGWITFENKENNLNVTAQLDAGSGTILNAPFKNISFLLSQNESAYPIIFRANAAGIDDVNLYGDFQISRNISDQAFDLMLTTPDPNLFVNYLKQQNVVSGNISGKNYPIDETTILLSYDASSRFADGPLPFKLTAKTDEKSALNGTFLIYPDSMDVRGTAQGNNDVISFLQTIFHLNNKNISDGNIRLDENVKSLF